jgi:hypothetical protein
VYDEFIKPYPSKRLKVTLKSKSPLTMLESYITFIINWVAVLENVTKEGKADPLEKVAWYV